MQDDTIDVNVYVKKVVESKAFRKKAFQSFTANNFSIDKIHGILAADKLTLLLQKAKWNRVLRMLLTDLLYYVDSKSMTDTNFRLLLTSNRKYKVTYLSCIGHVQLSFYQMQILNQYPLALEAFVIIAFLLKKICCIFFGKIQMLCLLQFKIVLMLHIKNMEVHQKLMLRSIGSIMYM